MRTLLGVVYGLLVLSLMGPGCSSGTSVAADASGDAQSSGDVGDVDAGAVDVPTSDVSGYLPGPEIPAEETRHLAGLEKPVRVIYDTFGVPHIYGASIDDLLFAQGYVTSRHRLFQMHTLRLAASGRLGEISGPGAVRGDVLLRILGLRRTAEAMVVRTAEKAPDLMRALEHFSAGVNAYINAMKAGKEPKPLEVVVFGLDLAPWTPTDILTIVRLQTWDLGFGGVIDEDDLMHRLLTLKATFDGTERAGIEGDVFDFTPPAQTPTLAGESNIAAASAVDYTKILERPFFSRFNAKMWETHAAFTRETLDFPHHLFRSEDFGSNNWVVAGQHTASGAVMVANDPHLSLRNPSVFFQVHLSNLDAGGDFEVAGVNFAGAPGIVLGHNQHAAWGGTVFYSDVTDMYVETISPDGTGVLFNGAVVPFEVREEVFRYILPGNTTCADGISGWIAHLSPVVTAVDATTCELKITVRDVPHHGPVVPWSMDVDKDGQAICMTWRWTGFEATDDLQGVWGLNTMTSLEDFKAALDHFDVGAQNWVYGDQAGNIAWYPSHQLPIRPNLDYPPFLPMPGDGSAEWAGFLPRDELPQSFNPDAGFIVTANADPIGVTYDNDPFNDGPYLGHTWAPGFRMERAHELVKAATEAGAITAPDLSAIQGDHRSNTGMRVIPHLLAAIVAAQDGSAPQAQSELSAQVPAALVYLADWGTLGYEAASGVGAEPGSDESRASIATAIFNAMLVHLFPIVLKDEGVHDVPDGFKIRLLLRMLESPASMATFDASTGETHLWDDLTTSESVETREQMLVRALVHGLNFLSDPAQVGVEQEGGFGTDDMSQWHWGALHTVTLKHNVAPSFHIPPPSEHPHGYPRPGDNFCVDASHPGLSDTRFTFTGGPSMRTVYELTESVGQWSILPGGQDESPNSSHYRDQMELWVQNKAPKRPLETKDVLDARETILDLLPDGP